MSTRAAIARPVGDGWEGVYHHSDGYPSGLGCYIFRIIHCQYKGDVAAFLKLAIDEHPAGWFHIFPDVIVKEGGGFDIQNRAPQCYCHGYFGRGGKRNGMVTWLDDTDCEWAYVLDSGSGIMTTLDLRAPKAMFQVSLNAPEPNWYEIECGPNLERCHHYRCVHGAPGCTPDCPHCHGTGISSLELRRSWVDGHFPPIVKEVITICHKEER